MSRNSPYPVARTLMIQGTGSDVGKSLIVAGLARAYANRGLRVAPFKPQNMSNNAAVTADGGEIGRAQALQARAARIKPSVHMNPVLLKPQSDVGSQVIVQGRVVGNARAVDYQTWKPRLLGAVKDSFDRLKAEADLVLAEGAGSASEINLRANDIANMGFARACDTPVIVVGDIDRGGVIAQIVGTKAVIDPDDALMVQGFIVNRFRGDPALFAAGMRMIEEKSGWPGLGLIPHFPDAARLPAEDALALARFSRSPNAFCDDRGRKIIVVPLLPHIANFDDLDPLDHESGVALLRIKPGAPLPPCDLVIMPGSKSTISDLAAFRATGWDIDLSAHVRRGGKVFGICGGYQMLGKTIADPMGLEGAPSIVEGLGLLDIATEMTAEKSLVSVSGSLRDETPFTGYEMHMGRTSGPDCGRPLLTFADGRSDGARSANGLVSGVYVHGLFADDYFRAHFLRDMGAAPDARSYENEIDSILDRFAAHLAAHVDLDRLLGFAR